MSPIRSLYLTASLLTILASLLFVETIGSAGMATWVRDNQLGDLEIQVDKGSTLARVSGTVWEEDGFSSAAIPSLYGRISGVDRRLKSGRYHFGPNWSPSQILEQLEIGSNAPLTVVLTPGSTLRQCAEKIESAGWIESSTDFIASTTGSNALLVSGRGTLEGLIAPETYFFEGKERTDEVVKTLHGQWISEIDTIAGTHELKARMRNGLSLYDTIILASLVEKEAANLIEMATVASVFHNRLRKNWPMGSVATIRYALHDWDRKENEIPVNLKSPFNTNRKPGLPPHPICSPSPAAIRAALYPPETPYLFFVADGEGGSTFNEKHEDHIRAARDYRKRARERSESK
ncbi:MAG: endolytic transglycosylase MltG [Candidatus Omnitrophica bacterium]|nr:endolytic transglycosylase MltG [Candidatus Omnitrophota bacterium]